MQSEENGLYSVRKSASLDSFIISSSFNDSMDTTPISASSSQQIIQEEDFQMHTNFLYDPSPQAEHQVPCEPNLYLETPIGRANKAETSKQNNLPTVSSARRRLVFSPRATYYSTPNPLLENRIVNNNLPNYDQRQDLSSFTGDVCDILTITSSADLLALECYLAEINDKNGQVFMSGDLLTMINLEVANTLSQITIVKAYYPYVYDLKRLMLQDSTPEFDPFSSIENASR